MFTTSRNKLTAAALALPLAAGIISAAPASAVVAGPQLDVSSNAVIEGSDLSVPVTANCVFRKCRYTVETIDDTAEDGVDYIGVTRKKTIRRGRKLKLNVVIETLDDDVCDATETFTVELTGPAGNGNVTTADGTQTITDPNCSEEDEEDQQDTTNPADDTQAGGGGTTTGGPISYPADSGGVTTTDNVQGNLVQQTCRTPQWIGVQDQSSGRFYNSGCIASAKCPSFANTCQVSTESGINADRYIGNLMTLNSRVHVYRNGNEFFHRDVSCQNTDWCRTEDQVMIRGGEIAANQCNGTRDNAINRAAVYCDVLVQVVN